MHRREFFGSTFDDRAAMEILLITSALVLWSTLGAETFSFRNLGVFTLFVLSSVLLGNSALRIWLPGHRTTADVVTSFLVGTFLHGGLLLCLKLFLPLPTLVVALFQFAVPVLAAGSGRVRADLRGAESSLMLPVVLAAVTLWSRQVLTGVEPGASGLICTFWKDFFSHAVKTGLFTFDGATLSLGSAERAGNALTFYHYLPYALTGALAALTGQSTLAATLSFFAPVGFLLVPLSAYAVALQMLPAGRSQWAAYAVLLLPDAAELGLSTHWLSFHWLLQISPGFAWGIGAAALLLLSVLAAIHGVTPIRMGAIALSSMLLLATKFHLFLAALPLGALALAVYREQWYRTRRALAAASIVVIWLVAGRLGTLLPSVPRFAMDGSGIEEYFNFVVSLGDVPTFVAKLVESGSALASIGAGVYLFTIGTVGAGIACFPLLILISVTRFSATRHDVRFRDAGAERLRAWIPAIGLGWYLFCVGGMQLNTDTPYGDLFELVHRPFVWPYFLCAVWLAVSISAAARLTGGRPGRVLQGLMLAAGLAVPWQFGATVQSPPIPGLAWLSRTEIPSGLVQAAAYIRESTPRNDIVLDSELDPDLVTGALTERRQYLGRAAFGHYLKSPALAARIGIRRDAADRFLRGENPCRLPAGEEQVRWLLLHPQRTAPPCLGAPAFEAGGFRVYRVSSG